MSTQERNWAGNLTYHAARVHRPETVEHVQELVRGSSKVRAVGSRHSFNTIADTHDDLISLEGLNRIVSLDAERRSVTVEAGIKYGDLGVYLQREGFALHNMASLPHISVAGACATATHGSGDNNGNLATAVSGLTFVNAEGELVTLSREKDGDQFQGAVVSLGGLGIIVHMTLDIEPSFNVQQEVYVDLPVNQLEAHFDEIESNAYSVSLFTDWQNDSVNEVWLKRRLTDANPAAMADTFYGSTLASCMLHPIAALSAENCTIQEGIPGSWNDRLPHFRMEFTPSSGEELQTEYFVPRKHAIAAMQAITAMRDKIAPFLMISEVRTIAADTLWMSPCYEQPGVGLHFTWKMDWPNVQKLLPQIEEQLAPFEARPHWGKLFTMPAARVQSLYKRLPDFQKLLHYHDAQGKFRNAFLDKYIFGEE